MKVDQNKKREIISNQTVLAFVIGLILVFIALSVELIIRNQELTLESIAYVVSQNQILWIIISAPLFLTAYIFTIVRLYVKELFVSSKKLAKNIERDKQIKNFTQSLINNDFSQEFKVDSEDDILGNTLNKLRDTLNENRQIEEKRRSEDELRNWMAEGLAKFGDILRADNDNLNRLAFNVIRELCNYLGALQGGFYLLNTDDPKHKYFDLISFYAYNREKYADKKLDWGVGLVGTCAIEGKLIYMEDLPDNYVTVTSGLGQANPNCLLLIPLLNEGELHGVLEIASLKKLSENEIQFADKVGTSVATTFSTLKTNVKTAKLLEDSKMQAEALAAQEEEMRQNMEELQATQEEAARQSKEFINLSNTVNHTLIRAEYNVDGVLTYANTKFLSKLEYTKNKEVEGKHISMFLSKKDEEWFKKLWDNLAKGGRHFEGYMKHITKNGKDLWTMATYTCVRNEDGYVDRILFLGLDTTEQKKISLNLEGIVDAVNRSSLKVEFDVNGNFLEYNESFINIFKYKPKDMAKLNVFDLIDKNELEVFNKKWENIINGMGFQGQFKVFTQSEEERWIRATFSAVYDMYGEVDRVILIGQDMTREKLMEIETKEQSDQLKKQEKQLREYGKDLSKKLNEAKLEMKEQFKEIEKIKIRNERTLEGALDAIITINSKNKIEFFNNAAEELWGYDKKDVLGKEVNILFDEEAIKNDEFVKKYIGLNDDKIIGKRQEVNICSKNGEIKPVLVLLSKAVVENESTFTAFIQNIEVELF